MRESQVLVCAQSNMAVDWISEKLVDRGINVLRIGNPTRVNDKSLVVRIANPQEVGRTFFDSGLQIRRNA
jgi:hypothetical protein